MALFSSKKIFWVIFCLILVIVMVLISRKILIQQNQNNKMTTSQNINSQIPGAGQLVNLSVGQETTVNKLNITLVGVVADSRCPKGANCIWPGEVVVEIKLSTPDNQEITTYLGTAGAPIMNPEKYVVNKENYRAQAYLFNRYAIIIEKVFPEKTTQEIVASAYKITFSVLSLGM